MAMTLITTNTITSGTAASAFTSSIDSTYKLYIFKFYDVHCADDDRSLQFQVSTDGGSSYGIAGTSTVFYASHYEDDSATSFAYQDNVDRANATTYMNISVSCTSENDASTAGELYLFNPSNTTYVKHWYATTNLMGGYLAGSDGPWPSNYFTGGYFNTTSAVNAINFVFNSSSNMDTAVIKMYGVG